jgi:hypothetical protein
MIDSLNLLEIYLQEYQTLKAEQTARIGFRDNLLYVTIAVFGGILSFTLANKNYYALLIVPWVCLILGWTYLVNDEKISAISLWILSIVELLLILVLGIEIIIYSDLAKG